MSLLGGLVETGAEQVSVPRKSAFSDWATRHAWRLMLGGSALFWLIVALVIAFH